MKHRTIAVITVLLLAVSAVGLLNPAPAAAAVGAEEARSIALSHAGLSAADTTLKKMKSYEKRGIPIYDIVFLSSTARYRYEINAENGEILACYTNTMHRSEQTPKNGNTADTITADRAREIALNHAGVAASDIRKIRAKLDREHGRTVYEVEFKTAGKMEYEYEIDAITGAVLSWESERD